MIFGGETTLQLYSYSCIFLVVYKHYFVCIFLVVAFLFSGAEKLLAQKDTILLAPATITGFAPERFMGGLKVQKIDSTTMNQYRFQNLADVLAYNTSLVFKNYGPGQLSTVSFRGTSASHTAVLWNGLNINSPTLGQSDFSTIPVAGFDQLSVQYGSSASIVGTDAVGGSILLESTMQPMGFRASIGRQQESFNNSQTQAVIQYGTALNKNWDISGKTAVYYGSMKNRFPDSTRRDAPLLPSQSFQKGLVQDIFLKTKNSHEISAHVWLTSNQLTLNPRNIRGREHTQTEAYRNTLRYQWKDFSIRTSWVQDILDYAVGDLIEVDRAKTDKLASRIEKDFSWVLGSVGGITVKTGAEWTHYITRVAGYAKPEISENRGDVFLLTRWQHASGWLLTFNLRQAFVTKYRPPFTPSLGVEYPLVRNNSYSLKMRGSTGRSYRVPTLNERYWKVLGTPDIKPENGWNYELGLDQHFIVSKVHSFSLKATGYHNRIKNWTYWNPGQSFKVENLQEVLARGVELEAGWNGVFGVMTAGVRGSYNYTKSTQEKVYDAYAVDVVGKQLTYIPVHSGNFNAFVTYQKMKLTCQMLGMSERYTRTDNSLGLDAYMLTNLVAETSFNWNGAHLRLQGQINNIANTFYLNVRNNAMPGRSFAVNLLLSYNQKAKGL